MKQLCVQKGGGWENTAQILEMADVYEKNAVCSPGGRYITPTNITSWWIQNQRHYWNL